MIPSFITSCTGNARIARDIYEFRLKKPEGLSFKAGQYVLFDVPLLDNPEDIQTRAFSIASAPHEPDLLFVAKMKEGGRASVWIEEVLKEGTNVRLQGPFGVLTLRHDNPKEYLLVGTSTGIAPYRSQIIDALKTGDTRRLDLIYGVRAEEDLFWADELHALSCDHPNFHLHLALSAPSAGWKGHKGRVQTLLPLIAGDFGGKQIYACGSPEMTSEVKKLCLELWGVAKADLHVEGYI